MIRLNFSKKVICSLCLLVLSSTTTLAAILKHLSQDNYYSVIFNVTQKTICATPTIGAKEDANQKSIKDSTVIKPWGGHKEIIDDTLMACPTRDKVSALKQKGFWDKRLNIRRISNNVCVGGGYIGSLIKYRSGQVHFPMAKKEGRPPSKEMPARYRKGFAKAVTCAFKLEGYKNLCEGERWVKDNDLHQNVQVNSKIKKTSRNKYAKCFKKVKTSQS